MEERVPFGNGIDTVIQETGVTFPNASAQSLDLLE